MPRVSEGACCRARGSTLLVGELYDTNLNSSDILGRGKCRKNAFPYSAFGFDVDIGVVSISVHKQIPNLSLILFLQFILKMNLSALERKLIHV